MAMQFNEQWMRTDSNCSADRSPLPKNPVVGMAYVPFQQFSQRNLYDEDDGLAQGTIFPDLDKPFTGWPGDWK